MDTATQFVGTAVPLIMGLWLRYAFQAVATTALVLPMRGVSALRTRRPALQIVRGLLLLASSFCAFVSLRHVPVAEFTAIVMLVPLASTLLAWAVLKEPVSPARWALIALGFAGVVVIVRPGGDSIGWAALLPLGLVATNAGFQLLTRQLARTEDPITTHLWTGWVGTLVALLPLPFFWQPVPSLVIGLLLGFMGLSATVGHFMLIHAFRRAPASTLAPYLYAQIVFAMAFGWLVFRRLPDGWSMFGIALIAAAGIASAWLAMRESRANALRTTPPDGFAPMPEDGTPLPAGAARSPGP